MECTECLNEDTEKKAKNMTVSVHAWVGTIKSLPVPNCLVRDITYVLNFMDSILTNEYQFGKAGFHRANYRVHCYV